MKLHMQTEQSISEQVHFCYTFEKLNLVDIRKTLNETFNIVRGEDATVFNAKRKIDFMN